MCVFVDKLNSKKIKKTIKGTKNLFAASALGIFLTAAQFYPINNSQQSKC